MKKTIIFCVMFTGFVLCPLGRYVVADDVVIEGVPHYNQRNFGPNTCGPVAASQLLSFWDANGFGELIDNGVSEKGDVRHTVYQLMQPFYYDYAVGSRYTNIAPGIVTLCLSNLYANNIASINCQRYAHTTCSWERIKAEIDAGRPFIFNTWNTNLYPYHDHYVTGYGYNEDNVADRLILIRDSYYTTNAYHFDNIADNNRAMWTVLFDDKEKHNTPFSDAFELGEGQFLADWQLETTGALYIAHREYPTNAQSYAHLPTPAPRPQNGAPSSCIVFSGTNYASGYMVRGPFSMVGKTGGVLNAYASRMFSSNGCVEISASTNGRDYTSHVYMNTKTNYSHCERDLKFYAGSPQVWMRIGMCISSSNGTGTAYIDDAYVKLYPYSTTPAPSNVTATTNNQAGILLNWEYGNTNHRVCIYRSTSEISGYVALTGWMDFRTHYMDASVTPNELYYYQVICAEDTNGAAAGEFSEMVSGLRAPSAPTGVTASQGTLTNQVALNWIEPYCDSYKVILYEYDDNTNLVQKMVYSDIPSTNTIIEMKDSFDTPLPPARYAFTVTGQYEGGETEESDPADGWEWLNPGRPGASQGALTYAVSIWLADRENINSVQYYVNSNTNDEPEPFLGLADKNAGFNYLDATPGSNVYVRVRSTYAANSNELFRYPFSDYSEIVSGYMALLAPTGISASAGSTASGIQVSCSAVEGASHYQLQRAEEEFGSYQVVSEWKDTYTIFDTNVPFADNEYWYHMQAAVNSTGGRASARSETPVCGFRHAGNTPPEVDAGEDQYVSYSGSVTLTMQGVVNDAQSNADGWPICTWTCLNGPGTPSVANEHDTQTDITFGKAGTYVLQLSATDGEFTVADTVTVHLNASLHYVSMYGADLSPYSTWGSAARTIQAAVDCASSGGLIVVSNGTYSSGGTNAPGTLLTNRVCINKPLTLLSVNGPDVTFISGSGPEGYAAVRGVYLGTNAVLDGFCISNGHTYALGDGEIIDRNGSGIFAEPGAVITNCMVRNNHASRAGGGIYCCTSAVMGCTILSNTSYYGGGIYLKNGIVDDGALIGNEAHKGGGAYFNGSGLVTNCILSHNHGDWDGGGAYLYYGGSVVNSLLQTNKTDGDGGGIACYFGGTVERCRILDNYASENSSCGGGVSIVRGDSIKDSLIISNYCNGYGGGVAIETTGVIANCTILYNEADENGSSVDFQGGGVYGTRGGVIINCIIQSNYCNWSDWNNNWTLKDTNTVLLYCCTTPTNGFPNGSGAGCFTNMPTFAPDWRLPSNSVCIDAGHKDYASPYDFEGEPRWCSPSSSGSVTYVDVGWDEYVDADHDGMPDWWERQYLHTTVYNGSDDPDGDDYDNMHEMQTGTEPLNTDTDGDGMPDGWEAYYTLNPLVIDNEHNPDDDPLNNGEEYEAGTNPNNADSCAYISYFERSNNVWELTWSQQEFFTNYDYQISHTYDLLLPSNQWLHSRWQQSPCLTFTNAEPTNTAVFYRLKARPHE